MYNYLYSYSIPHYGEDSQFKTMLDSIRSLINNFDKNGLKEFILKSADFHNVYYTSYEYEGTVSDIKEYLTEQSNYYEFYELSND